MTFYSPKKLLLLTTKAKLDLHAFIKSKTKVKEDGKLVTKLIETTVGRVMFNQVVPEEVGLSMNC
jgi:DNA-directed RNA polymerase subunit beta'